MINAARPALASKLVPGLTRNRGARFETCCLYRNVGNQLSDIAAQSGPCDSWSPSNLSGLVAA